MSLQDETRRSVDTVHTARSTEDLYRKVSLHLVPFLVLLYFVAFLDRVNISFASLTMNRDLGIADDLYGFAAGIFFVGYLLFAIPSNIMLARLGARRWLGIIVTVWGIFSCTLAFVHGPLSYVLVRFLIGASEAGFFPGVILYLTRWLPGSARAGIIALFTLSIPFSNIIGAPLSVAVLSLGGRGHLQGWQWLFLLEGIPAVVLGLVVPFALANGPEDVRWLTDEDRRRLLTSVSDDALAMNASRLEETSLSAKSFVALRSEVLPSGIVYFCLMVGLYAIGFWIPRILSTLGVQFSMLGWLAAVPFLIGGVGMLLCTRAADRRQQGNRFFLAFIVAGAGMSLVGFAREWPLALVGLSLAATGILSAMPLFWADFSRRVTAGESVIGIAAVNSLGNVGGFVGPYAIGWLLKNTHSFLAGLLMTSALLFCGAMIVFSRRPSAQAWGIA